MVIIRGVNLYPSALEEAIRSIPGVGEYRVTHDTREALAELSIEVEATEALAREVSERIQEWIPLRIPVSAVPTGSLPRFEHKARRWRRL